jgi:predicted dithiol-disulfide oxidoreductase (DUF899 family)
MHFTRLTESEEYRRQREELRLAELDLIDHVERVAALRRQLSADTVVDDYLFVDVASGARVPLSALFTGPDRALILYHFMYGKAQTEPCPLCTMWIDGYNAAAPHLTQNADFAVVAAAEPAALEAHAAARGWNNLRLLSAGDSTFKYDLGSEEPDGAQTEWISVFTLGDDGTVRHLYSKGAEMADERRERGIDLFSPVWHLLDLTPDGRDDWYPKLQY